MKYFGIAIAVFLLALAGAALGASNKINWLTQMLGGGVTATGLVAVTTPAGATAWVTPGTGILAVAPPTVNFANSINVPGTPNGVTVAFTLPNLPKSAVSIDINGLTLDPSAFSLSGSVVTFVTPPLATDNIQATYLY
jgi:hypothetical protein